jgi:hypothetical protein
MRTHQSFVLRAARVIGIGLAALHLLPARKHLDLFFADPSLNEAWKGFGAIGAIGLLLLPLAWQLRALAAISRWKWRIVPLGVMALVHAVPAADHLPKLFVSFGFGDAWRGIGSILAIAFFVTPLRMRTRIASLVFRNTEMLVRGSVATAILALVFMGCAGMHGAQPDGGVDDGAATADCPPCVSDTDCNGGVCAQIGGDSYCTPTCPNGTECSADRACVSAMTSSGQSASVCALKTGGMCAVSSDDAGSSPCGMLVPPNLASTCTSCSGKQCQTNGCYGGWWCNTATNKCQAPPLDCGNGSDSGVPLPDAGPVTGTIGPNGGTLSRLLFAVVGDTRPPTIDDTPAYPSAIIQKIYGDIEGLNPHPPFMLSTGDYNFSASYSGTEADKQIGLYASARAKYTGTLFPAMGNHECTGAVTSNCGPNSANGMTNNYGAFMSKLLGPIGKSDPYYAINVNDVNGKWTAKFVLVAANAWNATQSAWLSSTLAQSTTYTFIVRHEPHDATTAPGTSPSEQIMAQHPYTLCVVGHTHSYYHFSGREVLIGNGGAPLSGNKNYGFGLFSQRQDGAIQVDMIDYQSGLADSYFRFAVKPDGNPAP